MKNKIILSIVILIEVFNGVYVFAEDFPPVVKTNINLKITSSDNIIYDSSISVEPCDSDNKIETINNITPYCAIKQLGEIDKPITSNWTWYDFGVMLNSINNIKGYTSKDKDDNDVYHYWSWSLGSTEAMVGLNMYELKEGDIITLNFVPVEAKIVNEAPPVEHHGSSGSIPSKITSLPIIEKTFSIANAIEFLAKNQKEDGSFNSPMYTDWVAIAVGASEDKNIKEKLIKYYKENNLDSNIITDNERRGMALMALGINPYNGTEVNYIQKIVDSFDGVQFGDKELLNDDIFALIVLKNTGYSNLDEIILKDINYIISKQNNDGSFDSVDMTSASVQALRGFENITLVNDAITKAELYLISKQKPEGSFDNTFSTSWVLQTLFNNNVIKSEKYLTLKQGVDGGIGDSNENIDSRIWATAYAIPAMLHKPWSEILNKFQKEETISQFVLNSTEKVGGKKINKIHKKIDFKINNNTEEDNQNVKRDDNVKIKNKTPFWSHIKKPFIWLWSKL